MTDPIPNHRRSPLEHERDAGPDLSPEAVERLARYHDWRDDGDSETAATLRALSDELAATRQRAERAEAELATAHELIALLEGEQERADAAEAEVARLHRIRESEDMLLASRAYEAGRDAERAGCVARDPRVILSHARAAMKGNS